MKAKISSDEPEQNTNKAVSAKKNVVAEQLSTLGFFEDLLKKFNKNLDLVDPLDNEDWLKL